MNLRVEAAEACAIPEQSRSGPGLGAAVGRLARRKPLGALGGLVVVVLLTLAVGATWIAPYPYDASIPGARLKAPGAQHWMGTDNLSRDIWSRVVYGARVSVTVGFGAVAVAALLATAIGVTSAYFGGLYDLIAQRIVDGWMAFPYLVIILSLMAILGPGMLNVVIALGVLGAAGQSRVIRGATLGVTAEPFIEAARALGATPARVIFVHVLPNVAPTVIVLATLGLGVAVLAESALSFLGFGVPPPYPSWGGMLSGSGRTYMYQAPWMAVWPGAAISAAVFGFNAFGDAIRDLLDPRLRGTSGAPR